MALVIADETLRAMQMDEQQARVEIACWLFDAGRLSFGHASTLAALPQESMLAELERRGIPRYRYTGRHLEQDLESIERIDAAHQAAGK